MFIFLSARIDLCSSFSFKNSFHIIIKNLFEIKDNYPQDSLVEKESKLFSIRQSDVLLMT